ncbi:hypothetical protein R3P38DRAFT_3513963 [Favolaschia claudopus]|uniref:Tetratricopeptide repeat protein 38 n=1 Tax=Favolaschia claudopus TaxID=2862362 RepID=A0AAW0BSF8_9AGAR
MTRLCPPCLEEFKSSVSHPVFQPQRLLDQAITCLKECSDPALESNFYQSAGYYHQSQNNNLLSEELFGKALAAAQISGNIVLQSRALLYIGLPNWKIGNYVMGQHHASEAHRLDRLSGNLYHEGGALWVDALCSRDLGDYDVAIKLLARSRNCLARCGLAGGRFDGDVMISLADLHLLKSEYSEAYQIHTNMVQDAALTMDKRTHGFYLLNIAQIDVIIGTPAHNVQLKIDELKEIFTALQNLGVEQGIELISADLSLREGNHAHAQSAFRTYFNIFLGNNTEYALYAIERLADLERWETQYFDTTFVWAMSYLSYGFKLKNKLALHKAVACIGQIYLAQHDLATAHNLFTVALEGFVQMGVHHDRARCLLYLGNIAKQEGNVGKVDNR